VGSRFYHLDTCFAPVDNGSALYYPSAFDSYANQVIRENVQDLIPVDREAALRFACNAVVVGRTVVLNAGCNELEPPLRDHGYQVRSVDLSEFMKSGGSAKCLVLRLHDP